MGFLLDITTQMSLCDGRNATLNNMDSVFLRWHQFEFRNNKSEDLEERAKLIGAYRSKASSQDAIGRVKDQPGFREHPDGFVIDEYSLDQDHWEEGFVTLYENSDAVSQNG